MDGPILSPDDGPAGQRDRAAAILNGMGEGYLALDQDFRILDINAEGLRIDGRRRDEIVGRALLEVWPESAAYPVWSACRHCMATGEPIALEYEHRIGGRALWFEVRAYRVDHELAVFYRDVTARVGERAARASTELALAQSEERLRAIVATVPVGIVMADAAGAIYDGNARAAEIFGHPILRSPNYDGYGEWVSFHADGRKVESREYPLARVLAGGEERPEIEVQYQRGNGERVWVRIVGSPVRDAAGAVTGAIVAIVDIDEVKSAQLALEALNRELAARVERAAAELDRVWRNAHDLFLILDRQGRIVRVNPVADRLLGMGEAEMAGRSVFDFVAPRDRPGARAALGRALAGRVTDVDAALLTADGGERAFVWAATPTGDEVYAYGRDVTDERARVAELDTAREALRQSQKMEAVGQLTGGIAHDFNNMLAVVIGSLDLLGRRIGDGDARARRYVEAATEGARRAATLTSRLLAFSRQQPLKPATLDVNKLVAGISDLLRGTLGREVALETVLSGGLWRAHADPNQLENVILNLAVNARDAMPGGGRLTIETHNAHLDDHYAAQHLGVPAGQYVLIAVSDTGMGMTAEVIAKAFDPFFTTKGVGKGTGLGLSQVYGFVKQSGGHVKIYSEPGQGTAVKVYLPRWLGPLDEEPASAAAADLPTGEPQELILVVEDEPAVRQFSADALRELGYRVFEADGAEAALRLLDAHPAIVLLFTDIVMPEVNGARLADEARRRRPQLKVLFTTGYTRNAIVHNGVVDAGVQLLGKPYTVEALAAKVRAVLDGTAG